MVTLMDSIVTKSRMFPSGIAHWEDRVCIGDDFFDLLGETQCPSSFPARWYYTCYYFGPSRNRQIRWKAVLLDTTGKPVKMGEHVSPVPRRLRDDRLSLKTCILSAHAT